MKERRSSYWVSSIVYCAIIATAVFLGQNAEALDLSSASSSGWLNGAFFSRTSSSGSGTGNIQAFLRVQNNGTEEGYNSDYRPVEFDEKNDAPSNHSVLFSSIPVVNIGGTNYREFLLDAAEGGGPNGALTLTALKFYREASPNLTGYPANFTGLKWDLDGAGNDSMLLNNMAGGNGNTDMFAYIPDSVFTGSNPYLYLYCEFTQADASFEEWAYKNVPQEPVVPEPATLSLLGIGLFGLAGFRRRKEGTC